MDTIRAALDSALSIAALRDTPIAVSIFDHSGQCLASSRAAGAPRDYQHETKELIRSSAHSNFSDESPVRHVGDPAAPKYFVSARAESPEIQKACLARAVEMLEASEAVAGTVDGAQLRRVLSGFVTGVIVATVTDPSTSQPAGFTATALVPLSLEPPLIGLSVGTGASSHEAFLRSREFSINILHSEQSELALQLAQSGLNKFEGVDLVTHADGSRYLAEAMSVLICRTRNTITTGDHTLIVGEVADAIHLQEQPALLFLGQGRFGHPALNEPTPAMAGV